MPSSPSSPGEVVVQELTNSYHCSDCDLSWEDTWCCACDDKCPGCGKDFSPEDSVVEATFILKINETDCPVCDSKHEF